MGVQGDVVPIGYTGVPPIPASDIPAYNASASSCVVSLAPCPPEAATPLCQWPTCAAIGCVNAHWHSVESCISLVWCVLCVVAGTTLRAKCLRTPSSVPSGPTGTQVGDADPKCAPLCLIGGGSPKCDSKGVWPPPVDVHVGVLSRAHVRVCTLLTVRVVCRPNQVQHSVQQDPSGPELH